MATYPQPTWLVEDVRLWLQRRRHPPDVISAFVRHDVDGRALHLLTEEDLKEMGINRIGPRKRLMAELPFSSRKERAVFLNGDLHREDSRDEQRAYITRRIDRERWKTVLAFLYMNVVFIITSMVLVIAHERLPNVNSYPPLPDLLLDNLPHVPWAFDAAEGILIVLSLLWTAILVCHQHRCVILRRVFSLAGTVFLLRSITMLITSLSAPGHHLKTQCLVSTTSNWPSRVTRAFHIWRNMGMSLGGIKTCGDYMFSGHTVALTLINFFITEYTPSRWYYLHILSWLLNIFGIFFILAGHEHYSIDVFVAFYISSRLFLYYHTLANNRSLMIRDLYRTRIWFPLFYFFESGCDGIVPNEFEFPVPKFLNIWRWRERKNV